MIAPATTTTTKKIYTAGIGTIRPSPENDEIYGSIDPNSNEIIDLANDIARRGMLEPIVITEDNWLVSGHRRYAAAKLAGLSDVPTVTLWGVEREEMQHESFLKLLRSYNRQRVKNPAVLMREILLDIDPTIAHQQLIEGRIQRDRDAPKPCHIAGHANRSNISDAKRPMLNAVIRIVEDLRKYWPLTLRSVHYQLLNNPPLRHAKKPNSLYANDLKSYGDLAKLLTRARLTGKVPWDSITDATRPVTGTDFTRDVATFVDGEMHHLFRGYRRDLMQSQADHFEIVLEKMTLQNVIEPVANEYCIPMTVGRGYCSLEPRYRMIERFRASGKDRLVVICLSDFDPDGVEIAESFGRSLGGDFGFDLLAKVVLHRALLTAQQVKQLNLPPNKMKAKQSSSNYEKFVSRYGKSVYELEAVHPDVMQATLRDFIDSVIDVSAFNAELEKEKTEAATLEARKRIVTEALRDAGD